MFAKYSLGPQSKVQAPKAQPFEGGLQGPTVRYVKETGSTGQGLLKSLLLFLSHVFKEEGSWEKTESKRQFPLL